MESGEYIATILKKSLESSGTTSAIKNEFCMVVDLPSGQIYSAPKSYIQRWKDIVSAAVEIASCWKGIQN